MFGAGRVVAGRASSGGGKSEGATAIKANAKAGGSVATVAKHAKALNATSKQMLALFPKGSGRGDFSDKQTRALPAVWKD